MSLNQNVRSQPTAANPSGLYSDLLQIGQTLSGSGVPGASTGGIVGNSYIDVATGIEYVKQYDGSWAPIYDPSTLPAPDPFAVGTLNANFVNTDELTTDKIQGRNAQNILIDGQTTGVVQVVTANTIALEIGAVGAENNSYIQNNGYAVFSSGTKQYDLLLDNGSGKALKHECSPDYRSYVSGVPSEWTIENVDAPITLSSDNLINVKSTSTINKFIMDPLEGTIQANGGSGMTLEATNVTQPVQIRAGSSSGDVILVAGSGGLVDIKGAASRISTQEPNTFLIDHRIGGEDVEVRAEATGSGNIRLSGGATGQIQLTSDLNCQNNEILNVSGFNGSSSLSDNRVLMSNPANALLWSQVPQTIYFTGVNVGVNGVTYLEACGLGVNPAEVSTVPFLEGARILRVESALHYSGAWTWGGATTANIELGTIGVSQATVTNNWSTLLSNGMPLSGDYYFTNTGEIDVAMTANKLGCRINITGATPTAAQAELIVKVVIA